MNKILSICLIVALFSTVSCNQTATNTTKTDTLSLIPYPAKVTTKDGTFEINIDTKIVATGKARKVADLFAKHIQTATGFDFAFANDKTQNAIVFELDDKIEHDEGYSLSVSNDEVIARAKTEKGLFYAMQTLRQLLPTSIESKEVVDEKWLIPAVEIIDQPRFSYRGMHLDEARHFHGMETVKSFIDQLAYHKMNHFHWHLTDDQGWRIEIKKYPKLASISSQRNGTLIGHYNDTPQQYDGKKYGGYYTQEQIKEIVAYAAERFITVVPEIEMPGHAQAVLAAYPELSCEPEKTFEVWQKWGVSDNVFCPNEATFAFLEGVIDEVVELFPSKYIHIGGDECPKTKWKESDFCQNLIKEKGLKDEHELQSYFIQRMEKYINSKGKQIIGWDEILEGGLAPNATVMSWRGVEGGIEAAQQKHDVIMTPTSNCYLDYYQSTHPDEPLAIGGFLPLEKVYNFEPVPAELTEDEAKYILGAQVNLWTEYIPTREKLEYMAFPRLCALSEVVWTPKAVKNFEGFIPRIAIHIERLGKMNINSANHLYEIDSKTASDNGEVSLSFSTLADAKIYYTTDGSEPTQSSTLYEGEIAINKTTTVIAQAFLGTEKVGRGWEQTFEIHKASGKQITLVNQPHEKYQGGGNSSIINGVLGSNERYGDSEWLGFDGENCEALIDFGEAVELSNYTFRNFDGEGQWIYLPKSITLLASSDGKNFEVFHTGKVEKTGEKVVTTSYQLGAKTIRYLKVVFENYGQIPDDRQGGGNPAWLFVDEMIIN
jgi:hexosaminidase